MNRKLKKQIKAYTGAAGAILGAGQSEGQVVVTNYTPPITVTVSLPNDTSAILLDIDNDGVVDFNLLLDLKTSMNSTSVQCKQFYFKVGDLLDTNKVQVVLNNCGSNMYVPRLFNCGELIDNSGVWQNPGANYPIAAYGTDDCFLSSSSCFPFWSIAAPGIFGVKFNIGSNFHFGWIKVNLYFYQAEVIQSGYQLQPNTPVLACDTANLGTGISQSNFQFNFSQQNNSIHISTFQKLNHADVCVYDLLGKEILQQPFEGKETTIKIDKKGIYFIEIKGEKGIFRKKVFIY